jgi:sulfatase modifying factor 1
MKTNISYRVIFIFLVCISNHMDAFAMGKREGSSKQCCLVQPPKRFDVKQTQRNPGMILIPSGEFMMGADNDQGRADEYPKHKVIVDGFWIGETEVTNGEFEKFVEQTKYITTAEKKPDWEEIKKQLPEGTPKPDDSAFVPASLVFTQPQHPVSLNNSSEWWNWVPGANWQHPQGPKSNIEGKDNDPVTQVSWDDAKAFCEWKDQRLPTEAEWEWAARGGLKNKIYPWGDEHVEKGKPKANSWQGEFPNKNTKWDGFERVAPVKSYEPNGYKLYDMAGNVWEWCSDWYRNDYYQQINKPEGIRNPKGPDSSLDPEEPSIPKKVQRGGSFLCNDSYCSSYRVSARMKSSPDTSLEHSGFRCVMDVK